MNASQMRAIYARQIAMDGEAVVLRRVVPNAGTVEAVVRARVTEYKPEAITAGMKQGTRKLVVLASDVEAANFPLPFKKGVDSVLVRGVKLVIEAVDDSTRRLGGTLIAYEITADGS